MMIWALYIYTPSIINFVIIVCIHIYTDKNWWIDGNQSSIGYEESDIDDGDGEDGGWTKGERYYNKWFERKSE